MDDALARHVALAAYKSRQTLTDLVELVQNHCDQSETEKLRAAVAFVDPKIQTLLKLVFTNHPGVQQDLAEKTAKYGKPL
jgi:hypothetical protein